MTFLALTIAACDDGGGSKKRKKKTDVIYQGQYQQGLNQQDLNQQEGQPFEHDGIDRTNECYYDPIRGTWADKLGCGDNKDQAGDHTTVRRNRRGEVIEEIIEVRTRVDGPGVTVKSGSSRSSGRGYSRSTSRQDSSSSTNVVVRDVYYSDSTVGDGRTQPQVRDDRSGVPSGDPGYNYVQVDDVQIVQATQVPSPNSVVHEIAQYIVLNADAKGQSVKIGSLLLDTFGRFSFNDDIAPHELGLLAPQEPVVEVSNSDGVAAGIPVAQAVAAVPAGVKAGYVDLYQDETFLSEVRSGGRLEDANTLVQLSLRDGKKKSRSAIFEEHRRIRTATPFNEKDESKNLMASIKDVFMLVNRPASYTSIGVNGDFEGEANQQGQLLINLDYIDAKGKLHNAYLRLGDNAGEVKVQRKQIYKDDQKMTFEDKTTTRGELTEYPITFTRWTSSNKSVLLFNSPKGGDHIDKDKTRFDINVECYPEHGATTIAANPIFDCTKAVIRIYQMRSYGTDKGQEKWLPCKVASIIYRQQDYKTIFNEDDFLRLRDNQTLQGGVFDRGNTILSNLLWNSTHLTLSNNYQRASGQVLRIERFAPNVRYTKVHSWAVPFGRSNVRVMFQTRAASNPNAEETDMEVNVFSGPLMSYNQDPTLSGAGNLMHSYQLNWENPFNRLKSPSMMHGFSSVMLKYNDPTRGHLVLDFLTSNGSKQRLFMQPWVLGE